MTTSGAWVVITSPVLSSHSLCVSNTKLLVALCTCSVVSFLPDLNTESFHSECAFLFIFPPTYPSSRVCTGTISSRQHYLASPRPSTLPGQLPGTSLLCVQVSCIQLYHSNFRLHWTAGLCVYLTNYTESSGKKDYVLFIFVLNPSAWHSLSD